MPAVEVGAVVADIVAGGLDFQAALLQQEIDELQQLDVGRSIETRLPVGTPRPQLWEFFLPEAQCALRHADNLADIGYIIEFLAQVVHGQSITWPAFSAMRTISSYCSGVRS